MVSTINQTENNLSVSINWKASQLIKGKYRQSQPSWEAVLNRLHKDSPGYSVSPTVCQSWYPLDHGFTTPDPGSPHHQPRTRTCYMLLPLWQPEVHFQLSAIGPAMNIWYLLPLTVGRISMRYLLAMNFWHLFIPFAVNSMFCGIFWVHQLSRTDKTQFSCKALVFTVAEKMARWEYFLQAI